MEAMTSTAVEIEIDPLTGQGRCSHIVKPQGDRDGATLVMEARVFGTEVEALCGHRWVPQRDPKQYPVCQACKEIFDGMRSEHGWGSDDSWSES